MFKVGVVGPSPSVKRILAVAKEFEQVMEFEPYVYEDSRETQQIVLKNDPNVDAWIFSGQIPFMLAKDVLGSDENLLYIPHTGSSLYKCFLHMAYYQGKLIERISIDTVSSSDVEEALQELGLPPQNIYVKAYENYIEPDELLQFHLELWQQGKTEGALTCFQTTYLDLQKIGVPAYWISPTRMIIRTCLHLMAEKARASFFKDTQIGIEIIEVEHFDKIAEKNKTPYGLQYLELRLKEILIKLCETLDGSLTEKGNGRYVIFSSRGAIERQIPMLQETIAQLSVETDSTISVGIGYGETVLAAELNARRAIQQSKENKERGIVIVQEDGVMVEAAGKEEELSFAIRTEDQEIVEKLKAGNISIKTYNKLKALIRRMGWSGFTSKDMATSLHMTERNARRILTDLCELDLAECIGEEAYSSRGRPSKIYKLK